MLILLLVCIIAAYLLQKKLYEKYWSRNLDVSTVFEKAFVYEGEKCTLKEVVVNDKRMPLPAVEIRIGLSKSLEFEGAALENSNVSDQSYRRDVFALFSHQKIIRTLPFICRKRGFYRITRLQVVGTDFFYLNEYNEQWPQSTQLFVYPKAVDVRRIRLLCRAISGSMVRQNRLYPDPFEFSGIREYQKTDPMNQINWKASARSQTLCVNQFDSTTSVNLKICLDTRDSGIIRYDELTEEAIRIAASLACQVSTKNMDVTVTGNGICCYEEKEEELYCYLKAGAGKWQELNRKLACINTLKECRPITEILKKELEIEISDQIYVLISRNVEQIEAEVLRKLSSGRNSVLWVIPEYRDIPIRESDSGNLQIIRWEVDR